MSLRIFQLTKSAIVTVDPANFNVTNTFAYSAISKLVPDEKEKEQFNFEVEKLGKFAFKTTHRAYLLNTLFECCTKATTKYKTFGPYRAQRLRKSGQRSESKLAAAPFGIIELDANGKILQEYKWTNMTKFGCDEKEAAVFFEYSGRIKIFLLPDYDLFVNGTKTQLKLVGIDSVPFMAGQSLNEVIKKRSVACSLTGNAVSVFNVNKHTLRSVRMMPRQMLITEKFLVEKDMVRSCSLLDPTPLNCHHFTSSSTSNSLLACRAGSSTYPTSVWTASTPLCVAGRTRASSPLSTATARVAPTTAPSEVRCHPVTPSHSISVPLSPFSSLSPLLHS